MPTGAWLTMADLARRLDPYGKIDLIAEYLSQANEYNDDAVWVEGNELDGHKFTYRTSIPEGSWRQVNQGTAYSKSTTGQDVVSCGVLEAWSQIDRLEAERSGNIARYRRSEDVAFIEGMGQTMVQTQFYGNSAANPAEFNGFSSFYNTVSTATQLNAANVIDAGGTGSSNLSIWLICHGERTVFNVYPRGSKAGIQSWDTGDDVPGLDNLGNPFRAFRTGFQFQAGLCPMDWRQVARIANIDCTAAGLLGPNAPDLFALMIDMMYLPPALGKAASGITRTDAPDDAVPGIRPVLYTNRTGRSALDTQAIRDRNVLITMNDYAGQPTIGFRGIPLRIVDQLLTTESRVV